MKYLMKYFMATVVLCPYVRTICLSVGHEDSLLYFLLEVYSFSFHI